MKKTLIILALLIIGGLSASAQIKVVKKIEAVQYLVSIRSNKIQFCQHEGRYYLQCVSSKDFDHYFRINTGTSLESSKETISDIIKLINELNEGETAFFSTMDDKYLYTINKKAEYASLIAEGYTGTADLYPQELQAIIDRAK